MARPRARGGERVGHPNLALIALLAAAYGGLVLGMVFVVLAVVLFAAHRVESAQDRDPGITAMVVVASAVTVAAITSTLVKAGLASFIGGLAVARYVGGVLVAAVAVGAGALVL